MHKFAVKSEHEEAPAIEYVPAIQFTHAVPPVEYLPAKHCVQAAIDVLPAKDEVPAAQDAQTLELVKVFDVAPARAYFPIGHDNDRQAPPLPVVYVPAAHCEQSAEDVLPASDVVPAAQAVHDVRM